MKNLACTIGSALLAAPLAALAFPSELHGQEQKEEYVSQAERTTLVEEALPGSEGRIISINHLRFPGGFEGGRHSHTGPTYVYIIDGTFQVQEQGGQMQTFEAGELYEEPLGKPMQAFNASSDEPMEVLLIQVQDEGKPLMVKED